jgi:hypothetical protein
VLGKMTSPEPQTLHVSLDGQSLGEISLRDRGWSTYSLPLPNGCRDASGPDRVSLLKLEASHLARPAEFTNGRSPDRRDLGVALDYVRFTTVDTDSPQTMVY